MKIFCCRDSNFSLNSGNVAFFFICFCFQEFLMCCLFPRKMNEYEMREGKIKSLCEMGLIVSKVLIFISVSDFFSFVCYVGFLGSIGLNSGNVVFFENAFVLRILWVVWFPGKWNGRKGKFKTFCKNGGV
ncbi:hypothetical protein Ddye_027986 [Dipteronia dyeriana]|uniref:Uncharacterized protein n=1 Tax=Dipteronia dyeriana TaxID=168575 RepID=A0AAD9TQU0_9ROSI|nr:hypothetical protein Ddye_027986 [Dipteronia dyeriana]